MSKSSINYYLANINATKIPLLTKGFQPTIGAFYANCIESILPKPSTAVAWHGLLTRFANDPEAIFFLRRNASASNNDWMQIRRGFLTEYSDRSGYVFCDNFFAHYVFAMAIDDYVPSYDEFKQSILSHSFPYGFMRTKEELPLQAFPKGTSPGINNAGWKLAHLYSVNGSDYSYDYRSIIESTFPRGARSEWTQSPFGPYSSRYINRPMNDFERTILKSHFLRLASPLNYFLVPKIANETDDLGGNIGEKREVLEYVYARFEERYGAVMEAYKAAIHDGANYEAKNADQLGNITINISYGPKSAVSHSVRPITKATTVKPSKAKAQSASSSNQVTTEQLHTMARLYLEKSVSFRNLEKMVLGIDSQSRGGGFVAKNALNAFGITAANKGALSRRTLKAELEYATGTYKRALTEVYGKS